MGWWSNLFRNSDPASSDGTARPSALPRQTLRIGATGQGTSSWDYTLNLVGESHYQGTLTEILRTAFRPAGIPERGEHELWVRLVHEPENPYDENAVAAEISGRKVGYVPRGQLLPEEIAIIGQKDVFVAAFIGWSRKPIYGVRLDLQEGDLFGQPRVAPVSYSPPPQRSGAGFVDGEHYTEYVERVKDLKRAGENEKAVELLLRLVAATENESRVDNLGVAPWYYEQLAIVYRKLGNRDQEIAILQRFFEQHIGPGASAAQLKLRLDKLIAV